VCIRAFKGIFIDFKTTDVTLFRTAHIVYLVYTRKTQGAHDASAEESSVFTSALGKFCF